MNTGRSIKNETGEAEWSARVELAAAYRVFDMLGWTHLIHTHITAGVPGETDHYLINPYGLLWEEITASSLIKVDAGGEIVHQGSTDCPINPAGFKIHSALHTSERAAEWVMHVRPRGQCSGQPGRWIDPRAFGLFDGRRRHFLSRLSTCDLFFQRRFAPG